MEDHMPEGVDGSEDNRYEGHPFDMGASEVGEEYREFDEDEGVFRRGRRLDDMDLTEMETIPMDEYIDENIAERRDEYLRDRAEAQSQIDQDRAFQDIDLGPELIEDFLDGDIISVSPNVSAELIFSGEFQRIQNPEWSIEQQRQNYFKFDQDIQMNVRANIGDRIDFDLNYDTEASFDFDNEIGLDYHGEEDDIIQAVDVGDVSMPLENSYIEGSQSLFGAKTEMQFGDLTVTSVASQQQSETENITVEDGAQTEEFEISATEYDANRHFFLAQYFRENYNRHMENLPAINSRVRIDRLDVWVTNRRAETENTRDIVAFMDMAEPEPHSGHIDGTGQNFPGNEANTLFDDFLDDPQMRNSNTVSTALQTTPLRQANDYQRVQNAKRLDRNEYDFHQQLGYISLNRELEPDEVLAVAFEYSIGDETYQVGEFSRDVPPEEDQPKTLFLKKLQGVSQRPDLPIWDLMMKNVYSLGSRDINEEDFRLDVIYHDDESGSRMDFLPEPDEPELAGQQLIRVLGLDQLNRQQEPHPDGLFDFIQDVTVKPQTGRVIFPVLEPFGEDLEEKFTNDPTRAEDYVFPEIYDSTQFVAQELSQKDNFFLEGHFRGESSDEINIEAVNIPDGSVRVSAGGRPLQEDVHYTVDYALGRVRILDESILNSGDPINVSVEKSDLFNVQQKTLLGTHLDYEIHEDFNIGGTFLRMNERPIERRVQMGDEPTTNSIYGFDGSYQTESQFLTSLVDRIPFYDTRETSTLSFDGEFAHLLPGQPDALGEGGASYLDDFQNSERNINLKRPREWYFASAPEHQPNKFPNADLIDSLPYNYERAKMAWYVIDEVFHRGSNRTPDHIQNNTDMLSNHLMREVTKTELFPDRQLPQGAPNNLQTFDLAFYPEERGIYNYNVDDLGPDGKFTNPEDKWGGIMRGLPTTDFESANVEYIEFWMMDPYAETDDPQQHSGGDFYINLGDVSEDILKDGRKAFESGLPTSEEIRNVDTTAWGLVPTLPEQDKSFANQPESRPFQDVGLDGLSSEQERDFFSDDFLDPIAEAYGTESEAYQQAVEDPSNDEFQFYLSEDYDDRQANIIERYKRFNKPEGNTPTQDQWEDDFPEQGRSQPDSEDISGDFTMNELEAYFQYQISLDPEDLEVGQNYVSDVREATVDLQDGSTDEVKWYQFQIPVREYDERKGNVQDFRSIRFMRMFFHGFEDSIITRFGELDLVQSEWRRYTRDLSRPGEDTVRDDVHPVSFDIGSVSLEENASRNPIPYKMPPGIDRDVDPSDPHMTEKDERSLSMEVCNLTEGDARAVFKNTNFDIRHYEKLRMFAHLEGQEPGELQDEDLNLFIRLGKDQNENFYEYEMPLEVTQHGERDVRAIWPENNEVDLELQELTRAKRDRDDENASVRIPYTVSESEGDGEITVVGSPNLNNVRNVMIGLRNPEDGSGETHCAELWVNELRTTGFDTEGGWAANLRGRMELADLGEVTLSGERETIGFGHIEESIQERSRKDKRGYNFTSQLNMGNFLPDEVGLELPVYYSYAQDVKRPKYNPLSPDVELENTLDPIEEDEVRDSIIEQSEEYESRKSLNFSNVRLAPERERESRFYDINNFSFTYAFTERFNRDIRIENHRRVNHQARINYDYSFSPDPVTPFSNLEGGQWLQWLTDFNFYYLPQSWNFSFRVNRDFGELLYRNTSGVETAIEPSFNKDFTMTRNYGLNHNLTERIRLNYDAQAEARIEEPPGPIGSDERDEIRDNLLSLGTMDRFNQSLNATYQVPLDLFPVTDWMDASASYQTDYHWQAAAPANQELGNIAENSRTISLDGNMDFVSLYNKNEFLRTVNQGRSNIERLEREREREIQRMDDDEEPPDEINESRIRLLERLSGVLMSLRDISLNYSTTEGTQLPGFLHEPQYLGHNFEQRAPGLGFTFGSQDDIRPVAAREGWLTEDTMLNNQFRKNFSRNFDAQARLEPFTDFRINLSMERRFNRDLSEDFRYDPVQDDFRSMSPRERGNFSMSYFALPTTFDPLDDDHFSEAYDQFRENRRELAERHQAQNAEAEGVDPETGFPRGYSQTQEDVLRSSFYATYSGQDPSDVTLSDFPNIPLPNWRIDYTGLSRMDWVESFARSITINHAYRSNYNITGFESSMGWEQDLEPQEGEDLPPEFQVDQARISEQFAPLLGINISWVNDWSTRIEYQRTRNIALNFDNFQMIETREQNIVVGVGYQTTELEIPFRIGGRRYTLENELNLRIDFNLSDNITVSRTIDEGRAEVNRGQLDYNISPEIEYMLSDHLTARIFMNRNMTDPATSRQHPTSFTDVGFSLRYDLAL